MNAPKSGPPEGSYVKKLNLQAMYLLGKRLAPLENIQNEAKIKPHMFELWWARGQLREALDSDSPLLEATRRAAQALITKIGDVIPDDFNKMVEIDADQGMFYHAYYLRKNLEALESVMANEMPGCPAYIVSQKGIYRTEALIDQADAHFHPDLAASIPEQAKVDLKEAGKCLAFELPTACSFHLWRAVESVTDKYYEALTGSTFDADKVTRNWGKKIEALQAKDADTDVTAFLDHIRKQYRNPQTHPEQTVDLREAQMLFGAATSSIAQIVGAIQKAGPSRSLALVQPGP